MVEDEQSLARLLKRGLENEGYVVDLAFDGQAGQQRIELHYRDYDTIILDLMLPKRTGAEVCKNVRKSGITTPILILTAKSEVESKVTLLDSGCDDYMIKPFVFSELFARIRALTRRPESLLPSELKIGDLVLDLNTQKFKVDNKEIGLTLKEFRLLEYFMRRPDKLVKRVDLTDNIWDFNYDSFSNSLEVYVFRLRKKIGKSKTGVVLETVRGTGYRLKTK